MFVSRNEFDIVKEDLTELKSNTVLFNERFTAHTETNKRTTDEHSRKMDEIIDLIKNSNENMHQASTKAADSVIERLTREYETTSIVDKKISDMKACCRNEFVNKEVAMDKHDEIHRELKSNRDIAYSVIKAIRREASIAFIVLTALFTVYTHFFTK